MARRPDARQLLAEAMSAQVEEAIVVWLLPASSSTGQAANSANAPTKGSKEMTLTEHVFLGVFFRNTPAVTRAQVGRKDTKA